MTQLNLARLLLDAARRSPDAIAIVADDEAIPYGALLGRVRRAARALAEEGVGPDDRVALLLSNAPAFPIAYFAAQWLGAVVVPLNIMLTEADVAWHLEDSEAKRLIRQADWEKLLAPEPIAHEPWATGPDDTAVILYTSGTTGRPKGAELTHANLFGNAGVSGELVAADADTVALAALPLFHSFGQTVLMNAVLMKGGRVVLLERWDAGAALAAIERHRVTYFAGVPTMYIAMLRLLERERFDLSSLRWCESGGAPMPVAIHQAVKERFGVEVREGYGLSETSPKASFNVVGRPPRPGSIGVPLPGVAFRLVAEGGAIIEDAGVPGEIEISGPNVMKGYWRRPEATATTLVDGWLKTGDIGQRDTDGYYWIVDRKKDLILRGGYNVYPREVEEVLYSHPAVAEAAVIGVPDDLYGEEIRAVIVLKPGMSADPDELISFCRARLAPFKYPRQIEFHDALPKGPTGKLLKRSLRA